MTNKELNTFLKSILTAHLCYSIAECTETLELISKFADKHNLPYSQYPKRLKSRCNSITNRRRKLWIMAYEQNK